MSVESIGVLIPTAIPGLADAADIQAALRAYHYGGYSGAYDPTNTSPGSFVAESMAKYIYDIQADITALQAQPASGGDVDITQPVPADFTPTGIPNGFIWVDEDGTLGGAPVSATAVFTNSAPTSSLTTGVIWVDKDATSITANPFIPQAVIAAKGDLIVGTANDTASVLTVGTNGYILATNSSTTSGLEWIANDVGTVTLAGAQNLTDKTLTSPILGGTTTTASGNLAVQPATYILEVKGGGSTVGQIQLNCHVNSHGQIIASQPHSENATNTLKLPGGTTIGNSNAVLVSDIGTQTITNKTLTSPTINTATVNYPVLVAPEERMNVSATAATGTVAIDTLTSGSWYYTTSASGNWITNIRGSSSASLNSILTTGDSITIAFLVTQGATAYYNTSLQVDGTTSGVTIQWQGGTAPSSGNASSTDVYLYNIIKTASATFTVLASQTKFA